MNDKSRRRLSPTTCSVLSFPWLGFANVIAHSDLHTQPRRGLLQSVYFLQGPTAFLRTVY